MIMDINLLRGVLLVALIVGFAGIVGWAWSNKRKPDFDRAAQLPLEDDVAEADSNQPPGTNEDKD